MANLSADRDPAYRMRVWSILLSGIVLGLVGQLFLNNLMKKESENVRARVWYVLIANSFATFCNIYIAVEEAIKRKYRITELTRTFRNREGHRLYIDLFGRTGGCSAGDAMMTFGFAVFMCGLISWLLEATLENHLFICIPFTLWALFTLLASVLLLKNEHYEEEHLAPEVEALQNYPLSMSLSNKNLVYYMGYAFVGGILMAARDNNNPVIPLLVIGLTFLQPAIEAVEIYRGWREEAVLPAAMRQVVSGYKTILQIFYTSSSLLLLTGLISTAVNFSKTGYTAVVLGYALLVIAPAMHTEIIARMRPSVLAAALRPAP